MPADVWDRIKRVDASSDEGPLPVDLELARRHMRVDEAEDDVLVELYVRAAAGFLEGPDGAGIAIVADAWTLELDRFPAEIEIPLAPLNSITSITYTDADGNTGQTVSSSDYEVDTNLGLVRPVSGASWPSTDTVYNAVTVTFDAGYTDGFVPFDLRLAVLMLAAHFIEHPQEVSEGMALFEVPVGAREIIERYRRGRFA